MSATVTDPRGEVWTVRRRWVPRLGTESLWARFRRRFRRTRERADLADTGWLDFVDGGGIVAAVVAIVALVLLIFEKVAEVERSLVAGVIPRTDLER